MFVLWIKCTKQFQNLLSLFFYLFLQAYINDDSVKIILLQLDNEQKKQYGSYQIDTFELSKIL